MGEYREFLKKPFAQFASHLHCATPALPKDIGTMWRAVPGNTRSPRSEAEWECGASVRVKNSSVEDSRIAITSKFRWSPRWEQLQNQPRISRMDANFFLFLFVKISVIRGRNSQLLFRGRLPKFTTTKIRSDFFRAAGFYRITVPAIQPASRKEWNHEKLALWELP